MGLLLNGRKVEGFNLRNEMKLEDLLSNLSCDAVIALSLEGEDTPLEQVYKKGELMQVTFLVGGFSEGDFTSNVHELADIEVSLGKDLLKVWTVTCEFIASLGQE
jgi:rRNA pseudouridine-1189 N-methylase Emg1 (Nep1/Mra1 family)